MANVSAVSGFEYPDDAQAAAQVDWDFDGDLDLWLANRNAPQIRLLKNDITTGNHFVALRLEGTSCNRDAIGARVEVHLANHQLPAIIRTLRAGDGYLTQSSKWLTVGIGQASGIREVRVRWPSGEVEPFSRIERDGHYLLVQGREVARPWHPPDRNAHAESSKPAPIPDSNQVRIFSAVKQPLPRLQFTSLDFETRDLADLEGNPVLLNLWASWCQPCVDELQRLTTQKSQIEQSGLTVVALTVDHLTISESGDSEKARALLARMKFPFEAGLASPDLVDKLQLTSDYLFALRQQLPIPVSFLIDRQRRLAAIYRGPIEIDQLLEDVDNLGLPIEERRIRSVPFGGRWARPPKTLALGPYVRELMQAGFLEDASEYVQRYQAHFGGRAKLLDLVVQLGMEYHKAGHNQRADLHFQMARKLEPKTVGPELSLGKYLEEQSRLREASELYRTALKRNPSSVPALNNLAWLLATSPDASSRDGTLALQLSQRAVQLAGGKLPGLLDTMAAALAECQRFSEAVATAQMASSLAKSHGRIQLARQIEGRRTLYERQTPYRRGDSAGTR